MLRPGGLLEHQALQQPRFAKAELRRLWFVRNAILDDHNYCFKTEKGISAFGNDGCAFHDIADLDLNGFERFNLTAIQKM